MRRLIAAPVVALLLLTPTPTPANANAKSSVLKQYAVDTWKSMDAMLYKETGLVADYIGGDLTAAGRSRYTSPTNIGGYMWSAVVARDLGLISRREASDRIGKTLQTLQRLDRHPASGMFYNWYDPLNGAKIRVWPDDGSPRNPFLSSVDNGWLGAALVVVRNVVPEQRARATDQVGSDAPGGTGDEHDAGVVVSSHGVLHFLVAVLMRERRCGPVSGRETCRG